MTLGSMAVLVFAAIGLGQAVKWSVLTGVVMLVELVERVAEDRRAA